MRIDTNDVSTDPEIVADVEDFIGKLLGGIGIDAAVRSTWPKLAGPVAKQYVSDVSGSLIGWTSCGVCNKHTSRCGCPTGPTEPRFFEKLREQDALRAARAAGDHAVTTSRLAADATSPFEGEPSPSLAPSGPESSTSVQEPPMEGSTSKEPLVPCAPGKHLVPQSDAERNDDGSWTCFDHQATAAARGGPGDDVDADG